jgi:acyl-CoA hydrolase
MPLNMTQYEWVQGWNINGSKTLFGGQLLSWVDAAVTMLAANNSKPGSHYLTKGFEKANFVAPAFLGDRLCLSHKIVYIGTTSLWIWSEVVNSDGDTIFKCYSVLVGVDSNFRPKPVKDMLNSDVIDKIQHDEHWKYVELLREFKS